MKDSKVFLKCVKTHSSYLKEGKVYPATLESDGNGYYFTTDSNEPVYQWKLIGSHADFEIVQENEEGSMTSVLTLTPESLGCFQQVADVIGVESAREELQRVIDAGRAVEWTGGPQEELMIDAFAWCSAPQGHDFWDDIDDGKIPEGFTPKSQLRSQELSEPKFGDVLHYKGVPHIFIRINSDGDWAIRNSEDAVEYVGRNQIDEYKPDEHQEQRQRILERWQRKSLDNSHDTLVCIAEMRVDRLIDFVQENILAES